MKIIQQIQLKFCSASFSCVAQDYFLPSGMQDSTNNQEKSETAKHARYIKSLHIFSVVANLQCEVHNKIPNQIMRHPSCTDFCTCRENRTLNYQRRPAGWTMLEHRWRRRCRKRMGRAAEGGEAYFERKCQRAAHASARLPPCPQCSISKAACAPECMMSRADPKGSAAPTCRPQAAVQRGGGRAALGGSVRTRAGVVCGAGAGGAMAPRCCCCRCRRRRRRGRVGRAASWRWWRSLPRQVLRTRPATLRSLPKASLNRPGPRRLAPPPHG